MAAPTFTAAGAGNATGSGSGFTLAYPAGLGAGDLLLAVVICNAGFTVATPSNWAVLAGPTAVGANTVNYAFVKSATGSESGTEAFPDSGNKDVRGRMYLFEGWLNDATIANNFEGLNTSGPTTSNTIADASVTTSGADRLAVQLVHVDDDNALAAFTGMTGGTWAEAVAEYTSATPAPDIALGLQTATMATAATIDGGTNVMGASDPWFVRGFAIKPVVAAAFLIRPLKPVLQAVNRGAVI